MNEALAAVLMFVAGMVIGVSAIAVTAALRYGRRLRAHRKAKAAELEMMRRFFDADRGFSKARLDARAAEIRSLDENARYARKGATR